jgi:hypothetical protein
VRLPEIDSYGSLNLGKPARGVRMSEAQAVGWNASSRPVRYDDCRCNGGRARCQCRGRDMAGNARVNAALDRYPAGGSAPQRGQGCNQCGSV